MSRLPDSKSICEKYVLSLEDLVRVRKRANKILKILGEIGIGGNILSQIHIQITRDIIKRDFIEDIQKPTIILPMTSS